MNAVTWNIRIIIIAKVGYHNAERLGRMNMDIQIYGLTINK